MQPAVNQISCLSIRSGWSSALGVTTQASLGPPMPCSPSHSCGVPLQSRLAARRHGCGSFLLCARSACHAACSFSPDFLSSSYLTLEPRGISITADRQAGGRAGGQAGSRWEKVAGTAPQNGSPAVTWIYFRAAALAAGCTPRATKQLPDVAPSGQRARTCVQQVGGIVADLQVVPRVASVPAL